MPVDETKAKTTSTQFVDWLYVIGQLKERERLARTTDHYYLAQVARSIDGMMAKEGAELPPLDKYLIDFVVEDPTKKKEDEIEMTDEEWEKLKCEFSRAAWGAALKSKKTPPPKKKGAPRRLSGKGPKT